MTTIAVLPLSKSNAMCRVFSCIQQRTIRLTRGTSTTLATGTREAIRKHVRPNVKRAMARA